MNDYEKLILVYKENIDLLNLMINKNKYFTPDDLRKLKELFENELLKIKGAYKKMNKEEILQEINKMKENIANLEKQVELYEKQEKENKVWIPKIKEKYWTINNDGFISQFTWVDDDDVDNFRRSIGWVFKTEEEAERKLFELQLHRKLELFALKNNEKEIDWNNTDNKYYIYYDYIDKYLQISIRNYIKPFDSNVYFSSKEVANKAIETFKDDLIRYFTSNE